MSSVVCDSYQQHAWKRDFCANCLRPKIQHDAVGAPVPAKRTSRTRTSVASRTTSAADTPSESTPKRCHDDKDTPGKSVGNSTGMGDVTKPDGNKENLESETNIGEKPLPMTKKPSISSKPKPARGTVTKTNIVSGPVTGNTAEECVKKNVKENDVPAACPLEIKSEKEGPNEPFKKSDKIRTSTRSRSLVVSRPQAPPPDVPTSPTKSPPCIPEGGPPLQRDDPKSVTVNPQHNKEADKNSPSQHGGHYYHKYDLTGKGQAWTPRSYDSENCARNPALESVQDCLESNLQQHRAGDVVVALPYTVVDVSTCPPDVDEPPKLPSSPAPLRDSRNPSQSGTVPSRKARGKVQSKGATQKEPRSLSPEVSPSSQTKPNTKRMEIVESCSKTDNKATWPLSTTPNMPVILYNEGHVMNRRGSSPQSSRKVPILIQPQSQCALNMYEPVQPEEVTSNDDCGTENIADNKQSEKQMSSNDSQKPSGEASARISALLEAALAANMDLTKTVPPLHVESRAEIPVENTPVFAKKKVKAGSSSTAKTTNGDKNKKGRSFFKRLLKIGTKDEPCPGCRSERDEETSETEIISDLDHSSGTATTQQLPESFIPLSPKLSREPNSDENKLMLSEVKSALNKRKLSNTTPVGLPSFANELKEAVSSKGCTTVKIPNNETEQQLRSEGKTSSPERTIIPKKQLSPPPKPKPPAAEWTAELETALATQVMTDTRLAVINVQKDKPCDRNGLKLAEGETDVRTECETNVKTDSCIESCETESKNTDTTVNGFTDKGNLNTVSSSSNLGDNWSKMPKQRPDKPQKPRKPSVPPPFSPKLHHVQNRPSITDTSETIVKPKEPVVKKQKEINTEADCVSKVDRMERAAAQINVSSSSKDVGRKDSKTVLPSKDQTESHETQETKLHAGNLSSSSSQSSMPEDGSGGSLHSSSSYGSEATGGILKKTRSKSEASVKPGKAMRRMMSAPPPPPAESASQTTRTDTTQASTKLVGETDVTIAFDIPSTSGDRKRPTSLKCVRLNIPSSIGNTRGLSQTLPRSARFSPPSPDNSKMTTADDMMFSKRQMNSAQKHSRNKTVTEGIKYDLNWDKFSSGRQDDRIAELLEKRASKFFDRALPPLPFQISKKGKHCPEDIYEPVAAGKTATASADERGCYEDIDEEDIYTDPLDIAPNPPATSTASGESFTGSPTTESKLLPLVHLLNADYLEPVSHPDTDQSNALPGSRNKKKIRKPRSSLEEEVIPYPAPRGQLKPKDGNAVSDHYVMMYANTDMLMDQNRPPATLAEGFIRISILNLQTLQEFLESTYAKHIHSNPEWRDDLKFTDYTLLDSLPAITQGSTGFYRVRTAKSEPYDGFLMVCPRCPSPDLLTWRHPHVLNLSLMFEDRISAEYFPDPRECKDTDHYQMYGMVQTNMAVVSYSSMTTLESYKEEQEHSSHTAADTSRWWIWYSLVQIFNAVLYSCDHGYTITSLNLTDIAVVTINQSDEKYVILNPPKSNYFGFEEICKNMVTLLLYLLGLETPQDTDNLQVTIPNEIKHAIGLVRMTKYLLEKPSLSSLIIARCIVEYILWGPTEGESKSLLLAENREKAFQIWLEVKRCKLVNEFVITNCKVNLYLANQLRFFCSTTGSTLLDTARILYTQSPLT